MRFGYVLCALAGLAAVTVAKQPNIMFILADGE